MADLSRRLNRKLLERGTMARPGILQRILHECGEVSAHSDWRQAPPFEQAARLVLLSDITLTLLVLSAVEWPLKDYRRHLKRDAKALIAAMKDLGRVHRCWTFLAYAVVHYSQYSAVDETQHRRDARAFELLEEHFPVSEEDHAAFELIHSATRPDYGGPLTAVTFRAFELLVGDRDRAEGLALFGGAEQDGPDQVAEIVRESGLLELAWDRGVENYVATVEGGRDPNVEWNWDD